MWFLPLHGGLAFSLKPERLRGRYFAINLLSGAAFAEA